MDDLLLRSAVIPSAVAALGAGLLRVGLGARRGPQAAAAGIAAGFLTGFILVLGAPARWPLSAMEKVFVLAVIGCALGMALDLTRAPPRTVRLAASLFPAAGSIWIGWPRLLVPDWTDIAVLAATAIAGGVVVALLPARGEKAAAAAVKLTVAAGALTLVAVIGASASFGQISGALAAATAGFLVWLWPRPRFPFGATAALGAGGVFVALTGAIAVFTNAPKAALALLFPVFFADIALARLHARSRGARRTLRPILVGLAAAIPALAAIALAQRFGGSGY